ncbi:hypothetical protein PENTCL1PPCAC_15899, partial [Pristionchus entomophagus]
LSATSSKLAMPMVRVATNVEMANISDDFEVKLTEVLHESMGKPRERIMIEIDGGRRLMYGAKPGPGCQISIKSIGCLGDQMNIRHSAKVCDFIQKELGVPKDKILIEFSDLSAHQVGFNGTTVAEELAKR